MRLRFVVLAVALVGGCHWDLHDPGTDPKPGQLYFPSGIAMDPGLRYAYVSNGNADLRYGGGTLQLVDMLAFECAVAAVRNQADSSVPVPGACGALATPGLTLADPDHGRCRPDPLDPSIIDCDETPFIVQTATVRVGNFAGAIRVVKTGDRTRRLFVAVRGDPSITVIDVDLVDDPAGAAPGVVLSCYDHPEDVPGRVGFDPAARTIKSPAPCDGDFLVQKFVCMGLPSCQLGDDDHQPGQTQLPIEPFGMQIDAPSGRLLVAHQFSGQVSVIDIGAARPTLLSTSSPFFTADASGRHGAFALARQPTSTLWYMTSNVQPQIATFRVAEADVVIEQSTFAIQSTFNNGSDLRDIQFDPSGERAFVTENNPPSLLVLDTRTSPMRGDLPTNLVSSAVDICQTPSHMGVRRLAVAGAPGTPPRAKTKIVVPCFLSSQVMIVDPDRPGVDDTVFSGLGGPNEIAFNFGNAGESDADADPILAGGAPPAHGYVTNFSESTIALVDLQPGSPTENRVIARLGFPPTGFNP